ncbi:alpha/beta fold hydrolase [Xenorhabdus sp. KJ12.1]|uniref:alpha/beta fold hydrolase n=1 Tax=Xenorhabdus sp. KJ12.1 TaxID=1851571 RepID=UPI000C05FDDF|nr:alpha/beta fold hydrolase [Xenorhabdus sp. KJ12.1]PHM67142.1 beta-ketoacyl synthase [Xenorhabdus sp. KJ12.1]
METKYQQINNNVEVLDENPNQDIATDAILTEQGGSEELNDNDVVIVGMAGKFAGCDNLDDFWQTIMQGKSVLRTTKRWPERSEENWIGGFIEDYANFDANFFKISPYEARCMDPQQRLLLHTVQHAIDDSYLALEDLRQLKCGVFTTSLPGDYKFLLTGNPEMAFSPHSFLGNASSTLSGRISYFYDFKGPSLTLDTACSSSLIAINEACLNIQAGNCNAAIVGAVAVFSTPELFQFAQRANMSSRQGKCAAFGEEADGFTPGEGSASLVLMRYAEAKSRGLRIYGGIAAIGINHDGKSNGLMAPNATSQAMLIRNIYQRSAINIEKIACVETHGTGTHLGDPIEMRGLTQAFKEFKQDYDCFLGAIKPVIGHTLVCSGLAGIIKVLLSFLHETIAPFPAISEPNRMIDFGKFRMNAQPLPWPAEKPYYAVSAFGFTGANGHVVLKKYPSYHCTDLQHQHSDKEMAFCLSAQNTNSLSVNIQQLMHTLESIAPDELYSLSQLLLRRPRYDIHCVVTAENKTVLMEKLNELTIKINDGKEISSQQTTTLSEEMHMLASLWLTGDIANLNSMLKPVGLINPALHLTGYGFDGLRYWLEETLDPTEKLRQKNDSVKSKDLILAQLKQSISNLLEFPIDSIKGESLIENLGLDSLSALTILAPYQKGKSTIKAHDLFSYYTLNELAEALIDIHASGTSSSSSSPLIAPSPISQSSVGSNLPSLKWLSYGHGRQTVILAPPLNTSMEAWTQQIPALIKSGRRVFVPQYPGHRNSPFLEEKFSWENLAGEIAEFIRSELQSGSVDLVGWSFGGCISSLVSIRYPELIRSLVLISMAPSFCENVFGNTIGLHDELRDKQDILEVIFGSDNIINSLSADAPMNILRHYYEALTSFNIEDDLKNITTQTLLVRGKNDCVVDDASFTRLTKIPHSKSIYYEEHGHYIPLTASRSFNEKLIEFLDSVQNHV